MAVIPIHTNTVYRSSHDKSFETECKHEADAYDFVMANLADIRQHLVESERFTSDSRLEGAVRQSIREFTWFEARRRRALASDFFGIDKAEQVVEVESRSATKEQPNGAYTGLTRSESTPEADVTN